MKIEGVIKESSFGHMDGNLSLVLCSDGAKYLTVSGTHPKFFGPLTENEISAFFTLSNLPSAEKTQCDRCKKIFSERDLFGGQQEIWCWEIFKDRPNYWVPCHQSFCVQCGEEMTPYIWALKDIYELHLFCRKLESAIKQKRKGES